MSWAALSYADHIEVASKPVPGAFVVRVGEHPNYDEMLRRVRKSYGDE